VVSGQDLKNSNVHYDRSAMIVEGALVQKESETRGKKSEGHDI